MSLQTTEWKTYKSAVISDTSANGGEQSWNESVSDVEENVFPDLEEDEQTSGGTWYRKLFARAQSPNDDKGYRCRFWLAAPTAADDLLVFWPTTHASTQGDITGSERLYGAGQLKTDVSSGTTIVVTVEDWASHPIFEDGDEIYLKDSTKTRHYEISGTPSPSGNDITLTLSTSIAESWAAADTYVASIYDAGIVEPSIGTVVKTTSSGTFDEAQVVPYSIGSYEGTITLTFTSATAFDADIDGTGIGSGNISADFEPTNTDTSTAYLKIPSSAWGGTWANGETVEIPLHPPAVPRWEKRVVPASVSPLEANEREIRISYKTAA